MVRAAWPFQGIVQKHLKDLWNCLTIRLICHHGNNLNYELTPLNDGWNKKNDNNSISASITNNFDPIWIVLWITHVLSNNVKNQINQVEVCHKTDWSPNSCISDVVLKLTENQNWSLVKLSVWPDFLRAEVMTMWLMAMYIVWGNLVQWVVLHY